MRELDRIAAADHCGKNGIKFERVAMSAYTTFRIGGPADAAFPESTEALAGLVSFCRSREIDYIAVGGGSNILVPDEGTQKLVIFTGRMKNTGLCGETGMFAEAGASLASAAAFAADHGLSGLEFASGIPGSTGGGVFMNCGAYGGEMAQVVVRTEYVSPEGELSTLNAEEHCFGYRHSAFCDMPGACAVRVYFSLTPAESSDIRALMRELAGRRRDKQPLEFPSAGSFFKRPEGHYAGRLIEDCGLKGLRVGGAMISEKHAGFLINAGGATCSDVLALSDAVIKRVKDATGVLLEREVMLID